MAVNVIKLEGADVQVRVGPEGAILNEVEGVRLVGTVANIRDLVTGLVAIKSVVEARASVPVWG